MISDEVRENIPRNFSLSKGVAIRIETSVPIRGSCPCACRSPSRTGPAISTPFASSPSPTGGLSFMVCSTFLRSVIARGDTLTPRLLTALSVLSSRLLVLLGGSAYRGTERAPSSDPAPCRMVFRSSHTPFFPGEPPLLPSSHYPFGPLTPEPSGP